jgi:hypothetical protein
MQDGCTLVLFSFLPYPLPGRWLDPIPLSGLLVHVQSFRLFSTLGVLVLDFGVEGGSNEWSKRDKYLHGFCWKALTPSSGPWINKNQVKNLASLSPFCVYLCSEPSLQLPWNPGRTELINNIFTMRALKERICQVLKDTLSSNEDNYQ